MITTGGAAPRAGAAAWDERHAARDPIEAHDPDPTLVAVVGGLLPGRALDLATGDGRNAIWLAARGWRVTGVDFSGVALDRARIAAGAAAVEIDWLRADLLEWSAPADAFEIYELRFYSRNSCELRFCLRMGETRTFDLCGCGSDCVGENPAVG